MYKINTITGNITLNGVIIPQDDSSEAFQIYQSWLREGNTLQPTTELVPAEISAINREKTKARYEIYRQDGWAAYQDFRAKIVEDIANGNLTEEQAFVIEDNLKVAYDRIAQNGDWKTARYGLLQVVPSHTFVQPYLTLAIEYISDYIEKNYP